MHTIVRKMIIFLGICVFIFTGAERLIAQTQRILNFDESLEIARQNSPDILQARLGLERSQQLLNAQEASLKSSFGFLLEPFSYSNISEFNRQFSRWTTAETKSYTGTFYISQPILWTDGSLVLRNTFGWIDSNSDLLA